VLDPERCKPKDCGLLCIKFCPLVRSRTDAVKIEEGEEKPTIYETLCSGCGICVRKCPFDSIRIVNLPHELEKDCSHRFGKNMFNLYRLPIPQKGLVTGLIGKNGIGKSTALKILSGEIKANLGAFEDPPDWPQIINHYRGSILQDHFVKLSEGKLRTVLKPQYVDVIPRVVKGTVGELLAKVDERGNVGETLKLFQLEAIASREVKALSGGELQRFAIAAAYLRDVDVYLFDEPSSYLDVKQRLLVSKAIRNLSSEGKTVVVSEHDLAVLDYLSDNVCILYGEPSIYGVISPPQSVRVGINTYLDGYLPTENIKFRKTPVRFHVKPPLVMWSVEDIVIAWDEMEKTYPGFTLRVDPGEARQGEVIGVLGPNGIGKTTFIKLIAAVEQPDGTDVPPRTEVTVSYKPQYISTDYPDTVEALLKSVAPGLFASSQYKTEILQPFTLNRLLDRQVTKLSGGELQRVAIAACLSRESKIYLLDEPSAYLDIEERLVMTKVIRRIVKDRGAVAFVVEHDVGAEDFVSDRIMVFDGEPGVEGHAHKPKSLREGMNSFLRGVGITFRRDPNTGRPRVNKEGSRLDQHQKEIGEYYYVATKN
jgi:ATP-binding cassette subfamily E protein 1